MSASANKTGGISPTINASIDVSELKTCVQNQPQVKDQIFDLMNLDIRKVSADYLGALMNMGSREYQGLKKYVLY